MKTMCQSMLPSRVLVVRRLEHLLRKSTRRLMEWTSGSFRRTTGGRKPGPWVGWTFILAAALVGLAQVSYADRVDVKRKSRPTIVVQSGPSERTTGGPSTRVDRARSVDSTFRAKDIVPDICKGCSS